MSTTKPLLSQQFKACVLSWDNATATERKLLTDELALLADSMEQEIVRLRALLQEQRRRVTLAHAEAHQLREAQDKQESDSLKLHAELAKLRIQRDEMAGMIAALQHQIARSTISWKAKSLLRRVKRIAWPPSRGADSKGVSGAK